MKKVSVCMYDHKIVHVGYIPEPHYTVFQARKTMTWYEYLNKWCNQDFIPEPKNGKLTPTDVRTPEGMRFLKTAVTNQQVLSMGVLDTDIDRTGAMRRWLMNHISREFSVKL